MNRRKFLRSASAATVMGGFGSLAPIPLALAQSRQETLLVISESGPNSLDVQGVGTNRPGYEVAWNCYDRLVTYALKTLPDGSRSYDQQTIAPELAERWVIDAKGITFHLRKEATFHDGAPVTAADVKWSFDRAVSVGGFPTSQMAAGSLLTPKQFTAVDEYTFRVDFVTPDALTLPDIAVVIPVIYNSVLMKKNATEKDPWGMEFAKTNMAGGGAFKVEKWTPGTEVIYVRNDGWKCGPLPQLKRVIWRMVPSAGNRRALVERGDADVSFDMQAKDYAELKAMKFSVAANPISNGMFCIELNVTKPPFNNVKVRQAVAYAVPYQKIMDAVFFGEAKPLFGGESNTPSGTWPSATSYRTDLTKAKAKALLVEAGMPDGFETTISLDTIAYDDVPRIPLVQPYLSLAMQKGISGYAYWFHRQLDYRTLSKTVA